jgi:hypothetical protein
VKLLVANHLENATLGVALNLYKMFLIREGEEATLESIRSKFLAAIDTLPDGPLPDDTTIFVELEDDEAAMLVRVIDVATNRAANLEIIREQLGGGETNVQEDDDEETGDLDLFDLLSGAFEDDDDELTEVTLTVGESNMLAASNYAYANTYADTDDRRMFHEFGTRCDEAVLALPKGAEEVTYLYTEEEGLLIQRSLHQMDVDGRDVFQVNPERAEILNANLDSLMEKFSVEVESHDVPEAGPDEGGCAVDGDGFSSSGEPAGAGELSISES